MRAILTYHSIDDSHSVISIDERTFRQHADWLAGGAVRVVSVDELLGLDDEDAVALTFDDAFTNFAEVAWPILRERGLPVTLFVVSGRAGRDNAWGGRPPSGIPQLPLLGWRALGRLRDEGVEIGSHGATHAPLDSLDPEGLESEIAGSASAIERELGAAPGGFAYPYGRVGQEAERLVAESYDWACTTELAPLGSGEPPHRLPRLDAYYLRRPGRLAEWGTPRFRAWLAVRRAARRARTLLAQGAPA